MILKFTKYEGVSKAVRVTENTCGLEKFGFFNGKSDTVDKSLV